MGKIEPLITRKTTKKKTSKTATKKKPVAKKTVAKKTTKNPKSRSKVIPKLEIEKPHPRKLPSTMPPNLSKKPKTAAKRKPSRKDEIRYPGSIWKVKSKAAKKGWITRRKNATKAKRM